jgi:Lar family restriction alleviation protein
MNDTVSEDVKLEPCPFCGHEAVHQNHSAKAGEFWYANSFIRCPYCRANGPIGSQDEAVIAWNRRAYLAATKPPLADVTGLTAKVVGTAMQDAWDEICDDTRCHPLDIEQLGRRRLSFSPGHWAELTAMRILSALASPPMPGRSLDSVLDEYDAETDKVPLGHENRSLGRSTFNWRRSIIAELRAMLAASRPKEDTHAE